MLSLCTLHEKQVIVVFIMRIAQHEEGRLDLPPLHALQAFEATARLGSLAKAAAERHLTPSAISRAVGLVEHWSGTPLFKRHGPRISLTPAGHALRERMAGPLQSLHAALHDGGRGASGARRLSLGVLTLPSFAQGWLVPRLPRFAELHPNIELRLQLGYAVESLPALEPRLALRFGPFEKSGLHTQLLWRDPLVVVAAPSWVDRHGVEPQAWPSAQLLRMTGSPWPRRLGEQALSIPAGLEANDAMVLAEAACAGLGVAWLRRSLVEELLRRGSLLELTPAMPVQGDTALWLVCRDEMRDHPAVSAFWLWVQDQAALMRSATRDEADRGTFSG